MEFNKKELVTKVTSEVSVSDAEAQAIINEQKAQEGITDRILFTSEFARNCIRQARLQEEGVTASEAEDAFQELRKAHGRTTVLRDDEEEFWQKNIDNAGAIK